MVLHAALFRVLLAHVVMDAILWPRRHQEEARGKVLLQLHILWMTTLVYAGVVTTALLPDIGAIWPAAPIGFSVVFAVRFGVLFAQTSWTFPKGPNGWLKGLKEAAPLFYAWSPRVLWHTIQLVAVVFVCWWLTNAVAPWRIPTALALMPSVWIVLLSYAIAFWPAGFLVAAVTGQWFAEISEDGAAKGLRAGGLWIGRLERLLTVSFVLADRPEAIAALVVAKGVIRFAEIKDASNRRVAEYILIGSMMSFGIALLLGWGARRLLEL